MASPNNALIPNLPTIPTNNPINPNSAPTRTNTPSSATNESQLNRPRPATPSNQPAPPQNTPSPDNSNQGSTNDNTPVTQTPQIVPADPSQWGSSVLTSNENVEGNSKSLPAVAIFFIALAAGAIGLLILYRCYRLIFFKLQRRFSQRRRQGHGGAVDQNEKTRRHFSQAHHNTPPPLPHELEGGHVPRFFAPLHSPRNSFHPRNSTSTQRDLLGSHNYQYSHLASKLSLKESDLLTIPREAGLEAGGVSDTTTSTSGSGHGRLSPNSINEKPSQASTMRLSPTTDSSVSQENHEAILPLPPQLKPLSFNGGASNHRYSWATTTTNRRLSMEESNALLPPLPFPLSRPINATSNPNAPTSNTTLMSSVNPLLMTMDHSTLSTNTLKQASRQSIYGTPSRSSHYGSSGVTPPYRPHTNSTFGPPHQGTPSLYRLSSIATGVTGGWEGLNLPAPGGGLIGSNQARLSMMPRGTTTSGSQNGLGNLHRLSTSSSSQHSSICNGIVGVGLATRGMASSPHRSMVRGGLTLPSPLAHSSSYERLPPISMEKSHTVVYSSSSSTQPLPSSHSNPRHSQCYSERGNFSDAVDLIRMGGSSGETEYSSTQNRSLGDKNPYHLTGVVTPEVDTHVTHESDTNPTSLTNNTSLHSIDVTQQQHHQQQQQQSQQESSTSVKKNTRNDDTAFSHDTSSSSEVDTTSTDSPLDRLQNELARESLNLVVSS